MIEMRAPYQLQHHCKQILEPETISKPVAFKYLIEFSKVLK